MKFPLGQLVITRGADAVLSDEARTTAIQRHSAGDWGDVPPEDAAQNDRGLDGSDRLMSAYTLDGHRVWVITEWDRSVTTILLPEEY